MKRVWAKEVQIELGQYSQTKSNHFIPNAYLHPLRACVLSLKSLNYFRTSFGLPTFDLKFPSPSLTQWNCRPTRFHLSHHHHHHCRWCLTLTSLRPNDGTEGLFLVTVVNLCNRSGSHVAFDFPGKADGVGLPLSEIKYPIQWYTWIDTWVTTRT